ncbi:MAG TPA: ABC transporter substrate-binding protein [Burkholderiaceae bacterium]|nr:ABC transporter substrate-binding protein [Burkholderiaceae bacterium]
MHRKTIAYARALVSTLAVAASAYASAQTPLKIGVIAEMTGAQAEYGLQMTNGMKLYMSEHGEVVGGRKIQLIVKDVGGPNPEVAKRLAQELVTRDKVEFLAGFGFSPNALAVAPVATAAKVPMVVMNAATSSIPLKSPYIIRTSFTLAQGAMGIATWAAQNGMKRVFVLYADYAPGNDAKNQFRKTFTAAGGEIIGEIGVPLKNPEFGPYMERVKAAKPDALFMWFPSGELSTALVRSYRERGLEEAGIKPLGTGDAVDDMFVNSMGDAAIGLITASHYSIAHDSPKNKAFVSGYQQMFGKTIRPNFMAVGGYDGMAVIYEAVKKLGGNTDGTQAIEAMKSLKLESPRGPISFEADVRDIVQNIYIRRVERRNGELYSIEFATLPAIRDPGKDASQ